MLLDIREIQHVVALGRFRHFGRAAESLGISTPALSKSIRVIERALEVRLFERSRWGVSPTSFGEAVLAGAGTAIRGVDHVLGEIRRLRGLEAGTVRVGAGPYPLELSVADAAVRLAHRHPSLQLRLEHGDWESLTRRVLDGSLDVAVAEITAAAQVPELTVELIGTHGGRFYCRAGHPLLAKSHPAFEEVFAYPTAGLPAPGRLAPFFGKLSPSGRVDPASGLFLPAFTVDSMDLMKRAVRGTDAVAWAPEILIAKELQDGSFVALPFDPPWAKLNYGIIRRADRPMTPALDTFLVELRAVEKEILRASPSLGRGRRKSLGGRRSRS
jgi:DNA-binding transcriptional LysR family regulator